jgi:DNA-binding NtrC family response regulator
VEADPPSHVIERAVLMSSGGVVSAFDLALQTTSDARLSARLEELSLEEAERLLIEKALARFEGNANRAKELYQESFDLVIAENKTAPNIPVGGKLQPIS